MYLAIWVFCPYIQRSLPKLILLNPQSIFQTFAIYPDFDKDTTNGICPRYSNWNDTTCQGLMKMWICNFAMGDAPSALTSGCIWMNKFDLHIDSQAVVCIREYLVRWFIYMINQSTNIIHLLRNIDGFSYFTTLSICKVNLFSISMFFDELGNVRTWFILSGGIMN